jgi:hypothetical protein
MSQGCFRPALHAVSEWLAARWARHFGQTISIFINENNDRTSEMTRAVGSDRHSRNPFDRRSADRFLNA